MNLTVQKDRIKDGAVITFLAAVLIAVLAFLVCLNTKPGQLIPKELSLRENVTGIYIIQGIEDASAEAASINSSLSGNGIMTAGECWSSFAGENFDLFFLLAVIFPGAARFILELGFFLRFGLAAAFMYFLCCKNVACGRPLSVVLGLSYAFSSQVILFAQVSSVMNMTVLLPLALTSFDSFLRKRSGKNFCLAALITALFASSGFCADVAGLPFLALAALIMCVALYDSAKTIFASWARLLIAQLLGLLLAGFIVFPRFAAADIVFDIEKSFDKASVSYTFFDMLSRTKLMQPGDISGESAPVWYIGILTVTALVLFAANRKIPFRLKTAVLALTAVTFISCSSSFVREMFALYEVSPLLTGSRMICLTSVLIFAAALSLKNAEELHTGVYYASCIIPCAVVLLSNVRTFDARNSSLSLVSTVLAFIVCACAVKYQAGGGGGYRMKVFAVIASFTILCNASFLIANNTVKAGAARNPYASAAQTGLGGQDGEDEITLSVFTGSDKVKYLIVSSDLSKTGDDVEYIQAVNIASQSALAGDVFVSESAAGYNAKNISINGMNRYTISSGYSEIAFAVDSTSGGRCFVYSSFDCPATVRCKPVGMEIISEYDGACLCEIGEGDSIGGVYLCFNSNDEQTGEITFQRLIPDSLDALNAATHESDGLRFSFEFSDIPGGSGGISSVVFSIPYSDEYTVRFNGNDAQTFEYNGRLAAVFSCSGNVPRYDVVIGKRVPGLGGGIAVSIVIGAFLIAMTMRDRYNNKASSDGGKAGTDAQQENN